MWWVVATFAGIAVFAGIVGAWKLRAETVHLAAENNILRMQNANLRDLVAKLRTRARSAGADGAARMFDDLRKGRWALGGTPPREEHDANPLDDASPRGGGSDGAA